MNAYEKRKAHRELLRRARSDDARAQKVAECLARARRYELAYESLYGHRCDVRYNHGWYWANNKRYRATDLDNAADKLECLAHVQTSIHNVNGSNDD